MNDKLSPPTPEVSSSQRRALTSRQRALLRKAAEFVLAGEWPWEPEKHADRKQLEEAVEFLRLQPSCGRCADYRERLANQEQRAALNNQTTQRCIEQLTDLRQALRNILPMAESYLKGAPTHPDNAKLETARGLL